MWQILLSDYSLINKSLFKRLCSKRKTLLGILQSVSFRELSNLGFLDTLSNLLRSKNIYKEDNQLRGVSKTCINYWLERIIFKQLLIEGSRNYENYAFLEGVSGVVIQIIDKSNGKSGCWLLLIK